MLYLIRFNIYILNLNIQPYELFKKFTQFCTFNIHIFQKIYTFLHIQPTQFFPKKKNLYNFSKNIHNYVHSTYTFYKNVHNFVHSTNIILYIKHTQNFQSVCNFVHSTNTNFQRMYTAQYIEEVEFPKNVYNFVHSMHLFFK